MVMMYQSSTIKNNQKNKKEEDFIIIYFTVIDGEIGERDVFTAPIFFGDFVSIERTS